MHKPLPWLLPAALLALVGAPARAEEDESEEAPAESSADAGADEEAEEEEPAPPGEDRSGGFDNLSRVWLGNSGTRQEMHTISDRTEGAEGKQEVSVFGSLQVNGKWAQHNGMGIDYAYHPREALAITAGATWFAYAAQSDFVETELWKAKLAPMSANSVLLNNEAHVGLTVTPIYGKYSLLTSNLGFFGLYFGAAVGMGNTSVEIRPLDENRDGKVTKESPNELANLSSRRPNVAWDRVYGGTGVRPVGIFSIGFRTFFGENIALRAELRNTVFSNSVTSINGCDYDDLAALGDKTGDSLSKSCNKAAFPTYNSKDDNAITKDAKLAQDLVQVDPTTGSPSSYVVHNLALNLAFSVLF